MKMQMERTSGAPTRADLIIVRLSGSAVVVGAECKRSYNLGIPREPSGVQERDAGCLPSKINAWVCPDILPSWVFSVKYKVCVLFKHSHCPGGLRSCSEFWGKRWLLWWPDNDLIPLKTELNSQEARKLGRKEGKEVRFEGEHEQAEAASSGGL